jgi:hypothetical protein
MKPKTGGDCFDSNGREFLNSLNENQVIVHGIVKNSVDGLPMSHCWIEETIIGNIGTDKEFKYTICKDFSNKNVIELPKELYYHFGNIKENECNKYNFEEYQNKLLETNNWGPWDLNCDR